MCRILGAALRGREASGLVSAQFIDGITSDDLITLFRSWVPNFKNEDIELYGFSTQTILGIVSFEIVI